GGSADGSASFDIKATISQAWDGFVTIVQNGFNARLNTLLGNAQNKVVGAVNRAVKKSPGLQKYATGVQAVKTHYSKFHSHVNGAIDLAGQIQGYIDAAVGWPDKAQAAIDSVASAIGSQLSTFTINGEHLDNMDFEVQLDGRTGFTQED